MEEKNKDIVAGGQQEIYQKWPKIFHAVSGKSIDLDNIFYAVSRISENIVHAVSAKSHDDDETNILQSLTAKYFILTPPTIVSPYKRTTYGG